MHGKDDKEATGDAPLIPIVLGVVGHRDIPKDPQSIAALEAALVDVFRQFDEAFPNSPKILLSPLAPGTDQLAARVALRRPLWSVRAPLAFEPDLFRESTSFRFKNEKGERFLDDAARKELDDLLTDSKVDWFVVPLPAQLASSNVDWKRVAAGPEDQTEEERSLRRTCYANPGGYIVRHCHCLIALWDGDTSAGISGTAEIIRFQLGGIPPQLYPWRTQEPLGFNSDRGPVIWIHAPRAASPVGSNIGKRSILIPSQLNGLHFGEEVQLRRVAQRTSMWSPFIKRVRNSWGWDAKDVQPDGSPTLPGPWRPNRPRTSSPEYEQCLWLCQMIDDFNRDAGRLFADTSVRANDYRQRLVRADKDTDQFFPLGEQSARTHRTPMRDWYRSSLRVRETAAHLANNLSPVHKWAGVILFGLLLAALASFHLYAHPPWHLDHTKPVQYSPFLLGLFALVWLGIIGLVVLIWWIRLDDRRHDYRALAEALRVRRAWALAGLGQSVSDSYLTQFRSQLAWMRRALQHLNPPPDFWRENFDQLTNPEQQERICAVRETWVQPQRREYDHRMHQEHAQAKHFRRVGFVVAMVGLLLLVSPISCALAAEVSGGKAWLDPSHPPHWLLFAGSMMIIVGGLAVAACERRAHEELTRHYDQIRIVFNGGARELDSVLPPASFDAARAQQIIAGLGREALLENARWLVVRRSKPLELPLGA